MSDAPQPNENPANQGEVSDEPQLHDLVPFTAGDRTFAVFADQVDGTAEARTPAALPNAPPAVLGVVCMRGHMLTVLDPIAVITGERYAWPGILPAVIALRGDEQLALAAQSFRDTITITAEDLQRSSEQNNGGENAILGIARYGGEEIAVLRVEQLFAAAVRRKERRRRRI